MQLKKIVKHCRLNLFSKLFVESARRKVDQATRKKEGSEEVKEETDAMFSLLLFHLLCHAFQKISQIQQFFLSMSDTSQRGR